MDEEGPIEGECPNALLEYYNCNSRHEDAEEPMDPLPSEFSTVQVHFLEVSKDKLTVKYSGDARHTNDVGSIQANRAAPKDRLIYYYEATVVDRGDEAKIGIGFADGNFKPTRQPGWEPDSYGYHGDDGCKYGPNHEHTPYGPLFVTGDVIGAGIHLSKGEIFFTYNGRHLGVAFRGVKKALLPTIGLHSAGEQLNVNFGQKPFKFDVESMIMDERQNVEKLTTSMELQPGASHSIVRDFLLHYGYGDTLRAFDAAAGSIDSSGCGAPAAAAAEAGCSSGLSNGNAQSNGGGGVKGAGLQNGDLGNGTEPMCIDRNGNGDIDESESESECDSEEAQYPGLRSRMKVRALLKAGDVEGATEELNTNWPEVLEPGPVPDVAFFLNLQKFIELIRRKDVDSAMEFAQDNLGPMKGLSRAHDDILGGVFALVAYKDPEQSPLAHLLSDDHRGIVADVINAALVAESAGISSRCPHSEEGLWPPSSALEKLLKQLTAVHGGIRSLNGGRGERFRLEAHLQVSSQIGGGSGPWRQQDKH